MRLTDHDLKQLSQEYLVSLSPEQLLHLSRKMLDDLRDARDRLNQPPQNSSRPSGSYAPWQQAAPNAEKKPSETAAEPPGPEPKAAEEGDSRERFDKSAASAQKSKRKAGKQPGAKGVGRRVEMAVTGEVAHQPTECAGCGQPFSLQACFQSTTGLYVLDIERTEQGLQVSHIKHLYGEQSCSCGHVTQTKPGSCPDEPGWVVTLTEWHLVGPMLAALIICLSLRMRLSRPATRQNHPPVNNIGS